MFLRLSAACLLLSAVCITALAAEPASITASRLSEISGTALSRAPAAVEPANDAVLAAQITALVESVAVDIADTVSKGELLVQLDTTDFALGADQASARLAAQDARIAQARERLRRARDLKAKDYASDDELLARETEVAVLQADRQVLAVALDIARRELAKTRIVAPFDGVVTARSAQVGALATQGSALLTLVQTGGQSVVAQLPPDQARSLSADTSVYFEAGGTRWRLHLLSLSPVIDSRTRVQAARFAFAGELASAGLSGYLVWRNEQPVIASQYILRRGDRLGVFIVDGGRARFHGLPDAQEGRAATLALPDSTLIVTGGQHRLQDGDAVTLSQ